MEKGNNKSKEVKEKKDIVEVKSEKVEVKSEKVEVKSEKFIEKIEDIIDVVSSTKDVIEKKIYQYQEDKKEQKEKENKHHPPHVKKRVLFILKDRIYQKEYSQSYGLYNSANMVKQYLESIGHVCKIVTVVDSNSIDAEAYAFKPDIVIIEALWVTGAKMKELTSIPRYKDTKWIIRIHSNIGFLTAESRALKYIHEYLDLENKNVLISCNNKEFNEELSNICNYRFEYLPNIIKSIIHFEEEPRHKDTNILNIASFGALRILKNQLFQAMCSISTADKLGKILHFHINGDIQNQNNPVLLNIKELFEINKKHKLFIHGWLDHDEFDKLIKKMDMGLQLSFTESFNIVTADFVENGIPCLVSGSITWMPEMAMVSETDYDEVVSKMIHVYKNHKMLLKLSKLHLSNYNEESKEIWDEFIG